MSAENEDFKVLILKDQTDTYRICYFRKQVQNHVYLEILLLCTASIKLTYSPAWSCLLIIPWHSDELCKYETHTMSSIWFTMKAYTAKFYPVRIFFFTTILRKRLHFSHGKIQPSAFCVLFLINIIILLKLVTKFIEPNYRHSSLFTLRKKETEIWMLVLEKVRMSSSTSATSVHLHKECSCIG